jgi:RNA polymerase sigma-70 factor (ECF subfamily)
MPKLRVVEGGAPPKIDEPLHELPATDRELFDRFAPYVARIALRLLGREAEVDDVVQEVLLAAFRQRDRIREPRAFRGWLATVTVRTARRKLRYRRMRSFVGLDTVPAVPELRDADIGPEKRAVLSRVYRCLDRIPVEQRLAWTLRYVEGEQLNAVADKCGCSLATAKRRIAAAHARLQMELDDA